MVPCAKMIYPEKTNNSVKRVLFFNADNIMFFIKVMGTTDDQFRVIANQLIRRKWPYYGNRKNTWIRCFLVTRKKRSETEKNVRQCSRLQHRLQ